MTECIHFPVKEKKINAEWIAPRDVSGEINCYFRARKRFFLADVPEMLLLHVSAESYYILYINNSCVGRGPIRGTRRRNYFDSYNVSAFLRPRENCIGILCCCMNIDTFMAVPEEPGVIVELENVVSTDASWEVMRAGDWRRDVCVYTPQTGFSEWRDFRLEPEGWLNFEDSNRWEKAEELSHKDITLKKALLPRDIPGMSERTFYPQDIPLTAAVAELKNYEDRFIAENMTEEEHLPLPSEVAGLLEALCRISSEKVTIEPLADNSGIVFILDFNREIHGIFTMDITAPSGTVVDISHEEELWNGRLRAKHPKDDCRFADRYVLKKGRQQVGNSMLDRGFRMVQVAIRNFSERISIHRVAATDIRYPVTGRGAFFCNDTLLDRIWDVCGETLSACATDTYIDCPWRERSFWVNDMLVENITFLQAFGDGRLSARCFRLALSARNESGLVPGVCPVGDKNSEKLFLLPTNLYFVRMLKDYCMYTGDIATGREIFPEQLKIIDVFTGWINSDGVVEPPSEHWNFFDWSYGLNGIDYDGKITSLLNFFYIMALKDCVQLGELLGVQVAIENYRRLIGKVKNATLRRFYRNGRFFDFVDADGTLGCSSRLAHALALLSGEFEAQNPLAGLLDEKLLNPEFYFHLFIFKALAKAGRETEALHAIRKYWGKNVMTGTPSIWESGIHGNGKKAFGEAGSLCHGFATAPIDFFQTSILGIVPVEPGFKVFKVNPVPLDLEFARGRVPTLWGNINIAWEKENGRLAVELRVPAGLTAVTAVRKFKEGKHEFELNIEKDI